MQFDLPKEKSSIIKVIGVGGGGSNAVNHMYKQGIKDVDFIVCNTDRQVLDSSPVPLKIQLGATLTEGLGAGSLPEMGMRAALENIEEIKAALSKTKMLFITAGMGGGTGTGAAPVIAKIAREMGILTVSICTLPFSWEGKLRRKQAEEGLAELKKYSDSVLVILNDKIREIYHNLKVGEAFAHADNVLSSAAKCIAELINVALTINVDFNDVRRVMENSGVAIMGSAIGSGEGRALKAVTQALNSPLLNDNDIRGARYVLVSITCGAGKDELTMDELAEITDYVQEAAGQTAEMIKGYGTNDTLGDKVSVTIIASGFERKSTDIGLATAQPEVKMVHLEDKAAENISTEAVKKVNISEMTEPMLKSEVAEAKNTFRETSKAVAEPEAEIKEEDLPPIQLKKVEEERTEPLHIEVKLPPVKEETYGVEIFGALEEEKEEIKPEALPPIMADEPVLELTEEKSTKLETEPELPFAEEVPAITELPPVVEAIEEKKDEEQEFLFEVVKEEEKSIEFDLSAITKNEVNAEAKAEAEAGTKVEPVAEVKKEDPRVEVPVMNMEIKRNPLSAVNIERTVLPVASGSGGNSKVTKIAEVQLNSQPPISDEEAKRRAQEKIQKLRELSFKVKTPGGLAELENEPAYKRKNVVLKDTPHSSDSEISRLTLGTENNKDGTSKTPSLRPDNSFLHDRPD